MAHNMHFTCDRCGGLITKAFIRDAHKGYEAAYMQDHEVALPASKLGGTSEKVIVLLRSVPRTREYGKPKEDVELCRPCTIHLLRAAADEMEAMERATGQDGTLIDPGAEGGF